MDKMNFDIDFICRFLGNSFDVPCSYTFDGVDISDVMTEDDDGKWCDELCGKVSASVCWKRFIELWEEKKGRAASETNSN